VDRYHIDTTQFSLHRFKENLAGRDMIPSRVRLKDALDDRFKVLEEHGLRNLRDLLDTLKTKSKIEKFSQVTGLSVEYLTLLNREAKSYLPKPVRLDKFPGIEPEVLERLDVIGVRNSRHLFNQFGDERQREELAGKTDIPSDALHELIGLADLARAYGVGPVFARLIFDAGIHSMKDFIEVTPEEFIQLYEKKNQKKADFSVADIQFSLDLARGLAFLDES
jgi:hypothetical protein